MKLIEKYYGIIENSNLYFCENETANRLKVERGYTNETIEKCKVLLLESVECKYSAVRLEIEVKENIIDFGLFSVESSALAKNLANTNECYILAVTLGSKVDRLLTKLSAISLAEHYIVDALSSSLAESATDIAENLIKGENQTKVRFSPGYADFDIKHQSDVLSILDAQKLLGISLSKSCLMTPQKTVTAIIGIKK